MSEEEKKAIEHTERFCYGKQLWEEDLECIKALLNLIEKQNNRLEQLEKENKEYKEYIKRLDELNARDFISKSEIRDKIGWLKTIADNGMNAVRFACSLEDEKERIQKQKYISTMIGILKEILGEEND